MGSVGALLVSRFSSAVYRQNDVAREETDTPRGKDDQENLEDQVDEGVDQEYLQGQHGRSRRSR